MNSACARKRSPYSPNFPALFSRNKAPLPDVPPYHLNRPWPAPTRPQSPPSPGRRPGQVRWHR
jgi:hypothetical protein